MQYLLAVIGVATVVVLLWKAFGPQHLTDTRPVRAPDDDPEFLRGLNQRPLNQRNQEPDEDT